MTCIRAKRNFEELLYEAVDEGLSSLGESAKQATYHYLEKDFNLNKQEIPYKVKDFATAIKKCFGVGANSLEILIMKKLCEKVEGTCKLHASKDLNLPECVAVAKQSIELEQLEAKI